MNSQLHQQLDYCSALEADLNFLFKRLLDLLTNRVIPPATALNASPQDGGNARPLEDVVVQFEHAGIHYKLVKSRPLDCGRTTLSPREQEIVRLVSTGHPNKLIAHKLSISQHTVNTHVRRIFGKLGVNSRAEMVAYALQSGLVNHAHRYR
jgi:two-component system, NarL family, nitrate/nitrite response regulator NarL